MNILEKIVSHKKAEIESSKKRYSILDLSLTDLFKRDCYSLKEKLIHKEKINIIAEHKRQSPSKGIIHNAQQEVKEIIQGYDKAGACAISILTDSHFFGAREKDILLARAYTQLPILRKDFIIDIYQVHQAKSMGADVILLIGAILDKQQSKELSEVAHDLGLEVIYEIHHEEEIDSMPIDVDIIGINNRDLKKFEVDINRSLRILEQLPVDKLKIAESGISDPKTVVELHSKEFNGFLIGETFMKTLDPGETCSQFHKRCLELMIKR